MCGFLVVQKRHYKFWNRKKLNKLLKSRGPDHTNIVQKNNYVFIHNLLHLCGTKTLQPLVKGNIVSLFNGEIYNYKDFNPNYESDGECLIDLYNKYGDSFVQKLDGEFAIVLFDFEKNVLLLSSDVFATKPLFYYYDINYKYIISSIKKTITDNFDVDPNKIQKVEANTCLKLDLDYKRLANLQIHQFDLRQFKSTYLDYFASLENAVRKRVFHNNNNNKIFTTLSSGYDSGILALILKNLKYSFTSFTLLGKENERTIKQRLDFDNVYQKNVFIQLSGEDFTNSKNYVKKYIDGVEFTYSVWNTDSDNNFIHSTNTWNCTDDNASAGLNYIFELAKTYHCKIHLSGHGADEIISDYGFDGKGFDQSSQLRGIFPPQLNDVFPWSNFFEGTNRMFISKEEGVGSLHGIETRYPYLDVDVVQEFLNLDYKLKNHKYKSPLHHYMKKYNYPFDEGAKIGFKPNRNLLPKTLIS